MVVEIVKDPTLVGRLMLTGELDLSVAADLRAALLSMIDERPGDVTVDLSGVSFMDMSAVHAFVEAARRVQGNVVLLNPRGIVRRLLSIAAAEEIPRLRIVVRA